MFFIDAMNYRTYSALLTVELIRDLNEKNPVEERNEVAGVEPMPEGTRHDCDDLGSGLHFSSFPFVCILLGVVDVFVDISFEGPLNADVPVVNFHFEVWLKVELGHVVDFHPSKIVLNNFPCCIFLIL
jgi:hypothetical protein